MFGCIEGFAEDFLGGYGESRDVHRGGYYVD